MARVHRTTTTAALLVTVAAALTGCTTVQGPTAADPSAPGARSSAPRPDGPAEPRVVQAPAREALEMIGPSRTPDQPADEPRRTAPPADPPEDEPPAARARPERQPPPARPEAPERTRAPERPRAVVPGLPRSPGGDTGTGENADICSLGKKYGGWRPGSPEAVICDRTYGR
ncbi:hypothetical protein M6G08_31270 [Streptomyces sp. M92]|nr:hypothetical protein [Streptomyces sp. M92]WCN07271.1 hypothetical protein M6G08_31270 [Streptomyces sp. M92]